MGQNGSITTNPMLSDWSQTKNEPSIYTNLKTGEQVQRFIVAATPQDQSIYRRRMNEQHNFILKVHYYQTNGDDLKNNSKQTMNIYTDRFLPIRINKWQPTITALSILKGFRRLSTSFGLMRVTSGMIGMNQKDELKVWINKNPACNEPADKAINEEQMLADITKIIVQYDKEAGGLLIGCFTLNQAVNNMIVSMGQHKNQANLSSRTARGQQRQMYQKGEISSKINNNLFRSTKQTQDQFPKPLNNNQKRVQEKSSHINIQNSKYLMNVHLPQSPKYVSFGNETEKKKNYSAYPPYKSISAQTNERPIPLLNNSQKIPNKQITNIQFNSSNQERRPDLLSKKPYRGVEHKIGSHQHIGATSSIIAYTSNPKHQKQEDNNKEKSPEYPIKTGNILKKNTSGPEIHYLERKSDLTRQNLIGREEGRVSDFYMINQSSKLKVQANQKSMPDKKNNSRDIPFYYPPQRQDINTKNVPFKQNYRPYNFKQGQLKFEAGEPRTKTQQFASNMYISEDNSWNSYGSQNYARKRTQAYDKNLNYNPSDINFNKKKMTGNSNKNNQMAINTVDLVGSTKIHVIEDDKVQYYGSSVKNRQYTGKLQKIRSNPNVSNPQPKIEKDETLKDSGSNNYEERKVKKQELSKKIKAQISGLLFISKDTPDSDDQKQQKSSKQISNKDKKIVQKIKEKQAAFANLKTQAMKVLMGQ